MLEESFQKKSRSLPVFHSPTLPTIAMGSPRLDKSPGESQGEFLRLTPLGHQSMCQT